MSRFLILSLFVVFTLFGLAAQAQPRVPLPVDRVVAVVNDEVITSNELRERLAEIERQARSRGGALPERATLEKQLLERLIVDRLQLQFAKETGLRIADADLDAAVGRIAANNRLSLAELRAAVERDGINWVRFREDMRAEMILARLREREVDSRIVITEGEIDSFLARGAAAPSSVEVLLGHIIVRVPEGAGAEALAALQSRAEGALARLKAGESFARVATNYSDAPDAASGGMLDARPVERLPALYAEAAAKLQPGEVSGLLRSQAGFHIVKLFERRGDPLSSGELRQTHARHILIKVNELVSSAEAEHKLTALKERLEHGADFAELARLYSNDLSAAKGGDLGWLYAGDTVPDFERAMDALEIGAVSIPVRSPFGWHLIQVLERKTAAVGDERKRLMARQALRERKSDEAYEDWLRQLRDRAHVEYRLEER